MIGVSQRPEYSQFDSEVRKRGAGFLKKNPQPSSKQFKDKNYWKHAAKHLHDSYRGICAYSAMYLPEQGTVDHFIPKTLFPALAYEWSNFRLASGRINNAKGSQTNIIDPFDVQDDWFFLEIPACLLKPNPSLPSVLRKMISHTIKALGLNDDDHYAQERCDILMEFASGNISIDFLRRRYPFLAKEVTRQGLSQENLTLIFRVNI